MTALPFDFQLDTDDIAAVRRQIVDALDSPNVQPVISVTTPTLRYIIDREARFRSGLVDVRVALREQPALGVSQPVSEEVVHDALAIVLRELLKLLERSALAALKAIGAVEYATERKALA